MAPKLAWRSLFSFKTCSMSKQKTCTSIDESISLQIWNPSWFSHVFAVLNVKKCHSLCTLWVWKCEITVECALFNTKARLMSVKEGSNGEQERGREMSAQGSGYLQSWENTPNKQGKRFEKRQDKNSPGICAEFHQKVAKCNSHPQFGNSRVFCFTSLFWKIFFLLPVIWNKKVSELNCPVLYKILGCHSRTGVPLTWETRAASGAATETGPCSWPEVLGNTGCPVPWLLHYPQAVVCCRMSSPGSLRKKGRP